MNPVPESVIQREIENSLGHGRIRLWRQQAGRVYVVPYREAQRKGARGSWMDLAPAGAADLTGIYADGRRLEIEVKTPTGQQRAAQIAWQQMIQSRQGVYILARSVDDALRQMIDAGCPL